MRLQPFLSISISTWNVCEWRKKSIWSKFIEMFGHFKISPIFWVFWAHNWYTGPLSHKTQIRSCSWNISRVFWVSVLLGNHGGSPPFYCRVDNWFISDVQHKNLPNLTVLGMDGTECFYCLCVQAGKKNWDFTTF